MPRRNRRSDQPADLRPIGSVHTSQSHPDGQWFVRSTTSSTKVYRCPGCDQEIRPGIAHVVAWPADRRDGAEYRRHWHRPCWEARLRRPRR